MCSNLPEFQNHLKKPLGTVSGNVAHSNIRGVFVDRGPDANGQVDDSASYKPEDASGQGIEAVFHNVLAYKNRRHGFWARGNRIVLRDSVLLDNGVGANTPGSPNLMDNVVFDGETPNAGHPRSGEARSRVHTSQLGRELIGFEAYDNGDQLLRGCTCRNYRSDATRPAACYSVLRTGGSAQQTQVQWRDVTVDDSDVAFAVLPPYTSYVKEAPQFMFFLDSWGTWSGTPGSTLTRDAGFLTSGSGLTCTPAGVNAAMCDPAYTPVFQLKMDNMDYAGTDFGDGTGQWMLHHFGSGTAADGSIAIPDTVNADDDTFRANVLAGRGYAWRFPHATPRSFKVAGDSMAVGDFFVTSVPYPSGTTFSFTNNEAPAASVETLSPATPWFFDDAQQELFVRVEEHSTYQNTRWGFAYYSGYPTAIQFTATCPGGDCTVVPGPIPAALAGPDALFDASTAGVVTARATLYGNQLRYMIYHDLGDDASVQLVGPGGAKTLGAVGPIRGKLVLGADDMNALASGTLYVSVTPGAEAGARRRLQSAVAVALQCVDGVCPVAVDYSTVDRCATHGPSEDVLVDGVLQTTWQLDWQSGADLELASTAAPLLCDGVSTGAAAMHFMHSWSSIKLETNECVHTVDGQTHLQFFARTDSMAPGGAVPAFSVRLMALNEVSVTPASIVEPAGALGLGAQWALIRIPLASFGFDTSAPIRLEYMYFSSDTNDDFTLYVDRVQFVTVDGPARRLRAAPSAGGAGNVLANGGGAVKARRPNVWTHRGRVVDPDEL